MSPNHIQDIITAVKADKSIVQPWRNKTIARLEEAIAFMEKGQRVSSLKPPVELIQRDFGHHSVRINGEVKPCICPDGAIDRTCPVHGS